MMAEVERISPADNKKKMPFTDGHAVLWFQYVRKKRRKCSSGTPKMSSGGGEEAIGAVNHM